MARVEAEDEWWRENRDAKELFVEEFERVGSFRRCGGLHDATRLTRRVTSLYKLLVAFTPERCR